MTIFAACFTLRATMFCLAIAPRRLLLLGCFALGACGGKAHTPEEYLEVDSMVPRAQTLALAVLRLEQG